MKERLLLIKREQLLEAEIPSNTAGQFRPQTGRQPSTSLDKIQSLPELTVV